MQQDLPHRGVRAVSANHQVTAPNGSLAQYEFHRFARTIRAHDTEQEAVEGFALNAELPWYAFAEWSRNWL